MLFYLHPSNYYLTSFFYPNSEPRGCLDDIFKKVSVIYSVIYSSSTAILITNSNFGNQAEFHCRESFDDIQQLINYQSFIHESYRSYSSSRESLFFKLGLVNLYSLVLRNLLVRGSHHLTIFIIQHRSGTDAGSRTIK